jgi:hypothetical protein
VKWFERVDGLDGLRFPVPLEKPHDHLVRREVDKGEAMLLDRFHLFIHIEVRGWHCPGPASPRGPAIGPGA